MLHMLLNSEALDPDPIHPNANVKQPKQGFKNVIVKWLLRLMVVLCQK